MGYEITEKRPHPAKFACLVKFNGAEPQYYEVDSLDPVEIDRVLAVVAADDAARKAVIADVAAKADAVDLDAGRVK